MHSSNTTIVRGVQKLPHKKGSRHFKLSQRCPQQRGSTLVHILYSTISMAHPMRTNTARSSHTNVSPGCLHRSNLSPSVCLNLILFRSAQDGLPTVATNSIDGIECDTSHCVPHVLDGSNTKVHARGQHVIDRSPSVQL